MGYTFHCFTSSTFALASPRSRHLSPTSRQTVHGASCLTKSPLPLLIVARAGPSHCEPSSGSNRFCGLHAPLEPKSQAGLFLSAVFQNQRHVFDEAVADELKILAEERDDAVSRLVMCSSSDEFLLHRRILQLKEEECRHAVEDVMYMLIFSKFSDIRVPLIPKLSRCICYGRLEILPSKDWELESIHNGEVLGIIKQHIFEVIGLRVDSNVTKSWATTEVLKRKLGQIYAGSILYGYFLKSAATRHYLERCFSVARRAYDIEPRTSLQLPNSEQRGLPDTTLKHRRNSFTLSDKMTSKVDLDSGNLRSYVIGFDLESRQRCENVKSKEAASLIKKQIYALFCNEIENLEVNDEIIITSFASMKRLILEAIAFGSFLWDTEEYVNSLFRLEEN